MHDPDRVQAGLRRSVGGAGSVVSEPGRLNVLGVAVNPIEPGAAVDVVADAAAAGRPLGVACLAVHGIMIAVGEADFRHRLNDLEMVVADGQPIRWALNKLHSAGLRQRVYGPDLMLACCRRAAKEGLGVYFYGSRRETLELLVVRLAAELPELRIAGVQAGRYRQATEDEHQADLARIRDSGAAVVFVGLGCPRQEIWLYENRRELSMPVLGVGAAFDYHAGQLPWPPRWMQRCGLEWAYRLWKEPRRLWRRYLRLNPWYLWLLMLQLLKLRRFEIDTQEEAPPLLRPS